MKKLTKRWQIMLYAVSGMGINMLNLMMGSYLCSALLVGGFGAEAIPFQTYAQRDLIIPAVWAVFALAAKVLDGIIDLPMASLTDNLRSRWGRRRPSLVLGLVPLLVSYVLFLLVPDPSGASWLNTAYYGVVLCVFYSFYTLTMTTYYATFTEIVETERERSLIANVKSVCDIVYFILGYVVVRMLLNGLNVRVVSLIVLPLAMTMLIPLFMIKEPSSLKNSERIKTVSLVRSLGCTVRNKPFMIWMVVYAFMTFGVQLFLGGINEYFSFVGLNMIVVMGSTFAPVPLALVLYNKIHRRKGFGFAFRYVLLTYSVGMILMFFVGSMAPGLSKTLFSVGCGLCCSLAVGALFAVAYSVPAQLAAEEEARTGISNSAMYFAVQGLFSGVATGVATGVVLTALKGAETDNSGAMIYLTLIAGLGTVAAAVFTAILPKSILLMGKSEKTKVK